MARVKPQIGKVLLVGLGSGLIAAWSMNRFQAALSKVSRLQKEDEPKEPPRQSKTEQEEPDDATMKTANRIVHMLLNRELSKEEKKKAGPLVHYAFGAAMGAVYSMAAVVDPEVTRGFGTAFGSALFAVADELAVPMLGLAKKPTEYPLSSHASAFAAHLVYGLTAEGVRRTSMALL